MKISTTSTEKIQAALERVQKGCTARCYTTGYIAQLAERAEKEIEKTGLAKCLYHGATYTDGHEKFPAAYGHVPTGSVAVLQRGSSGWFLVKLTRGYCGAVSQNGLRLTENAIEYLKNKISLLYGPR